MPTSVNAEVRPTNGTLLAIVPAAFFGVGLGLFIGSLFVSAEVFEELLAPTPLGVMTVGALLIAAAFIANRRGFAPTEVRVEDDRLLVRAPEAWWVTVTDQFPLTVRTVERTAGALVVTGLLDRWWDWGRYTVRIEIGRGGGAGRPLGRTQAGVRAGPKRSPPPAHRPANGDQRRDTTVVFLARTGNVAPVTRSGEVTANEPGTYELIALRPGTEN